jgi:hypothetical protein
MSKRYSIRAAALAASGRDVLTTSIDCSGCVLELETRRTDDLVIDEKSGPVFVDRDAGLLGNERANFTIPRQLPVVL